MLAETVQNLFTPEFSGDMWDTLEVSGLWPIKGNVNGGMEIGDRHSVVYLTRSYQYHSFCE